MLALIMVLMLQNFAASAHFHGEEANQCHSSTDSSHNEADFATASQPSQEGRSDSSDYCHVHCCSSYIQIEPRFATFYKLTTVNKSAIKILRLNNYHNSVYRPPIA